MYTVLGASGNTGSIIARKLLEKGEKVRVVGRHESKLQQFAQRGAECVIGDVTDAAGVGTRPAGNSVGAHRRAARAHLLNRALSSGQRPRVDC